MKNNKPLTTPSNNKIKVKGEKEARELSKYLLLCLNSKSKVKNFFFKILFFRFDFNKKKKLDIIENIVSFLNTDLVCYRAEKFRIRQNPNKTLEPFNSLCRRKI